MQKKNEKGWRTYDLEKLQAAKQNLEGAKDLLEKESALTTAELKTLQTIIDTITHLQKQQKQTP